jgi:hypothetical protein
LVASGSTRSACGLPIDLEQSASRSAHGTHCTRILCRLSSAGQQLRDRLSVQDDYRERHAKKDRRHDRSHTESDRPAVLSFFGVPSAVLPSSLASSGPAKELTRFFAYRSARIIGRWMRRQTGWWCWPCSQGRVGERGRGAGASDPNGTVRAPRDDLQGCSTLLTL